LEDKTIIFENNQQREIGSNKNMNSIKLFAKKCENRNKKQTKQKVQRVVQKINIRILYRYSEYCKAKKKK
jgi:hypothetical protein